MLDVAAALKRRNIDVFVVFIGSFIRGKDDVEAKFNERAKALGLEGDILVTGYIEKDLEIFALFDQVDTFVYSFAEGLSSRRGSVLACLQSGRPVLVNAPATLDEFDHHPTFRNAMTQPVLRLAPPNAGAEEYAGAIMTAGRVRAAEPLKFFDKSWRDAAFSIRTAIAARPVVPAIAKPSYGQSGDALLASRARNSFNSRL